MKIRRRHLAVLLPLLVSTLTVVTAQARIISSNSFESPVVSGRVNTDPDGWIGASGYGTGTDGIENEDTGAFTTPYGSQAAVVWRGPDRSCLTTSESMFTDTLVAGITYTVTCYVAAPTNQPGKGGYEIELVAFPAGDPRNYNNRGTVIKKATGVAQTNDMTEMVSFSFTTNALHPQLGQMLAIRIGNQTECVVDNLVFEDDTDGSDVYPPALSYRYPRDNQKTATIDYPLLMTFNEAVTNGTGNITVFQASDDSVYETIDVTSGQVLISSNEVKITRNVNLVRGGSYYVKVDAGAIVDLSSNDFVGISTTNQWNFSTPIPDGSTVIYETSFESPVVSGRVATAPTSWVLSTGYGTGSQGLMNTNHGTFSTPYGSQVAVIWGGDRCMITSSSNAFDDVLQAEYPYTVSFNVSRPTDLPGLYEVQLVAFDPSEPRNRSTQENDGTVLAKATGTAILSDMAAAADAFTYTASVTNAHLGKPLAVRIWKYNGAVDNLKFTWIPPPPAGTVLIIK